jgi:hypothetical protein
MAKRRNNSPAEIQERIAQANRKRVENEHIKKEYDLAYRASWHFKASFVIRVIIILFCIYIYTLDTVFFNAKIEVITSCKVETEAVINPSKRGVSHHKETYAHIGTMTGNNYSVNLDGEGDGKNFVTGDTIVVQHTIIYKPSYIANTHGKYYFPTKEHSFFKPMFLFLGIVSVISLFMTGGYDLSVRIFVRFATTAGILVLFFYLIF